MEVKPPFSMCFYALHLHVTQRGESNASIIVDDIYIYKQSLATCIEQTLPPETYNPNELH